MKGSGSIDFCGQASLLAVQTAASAHLYWYALYVPLLVQPLRGFWKVRKQRTHGEKDLKDKGAPPGGRSTEVPLIVADELSDEPPCRSVHGDRLPNISPGYCRY